MNRLGERLAVTASDPSGYRIRPEHPPADLRGTITHGRGISREARKFLGANMPARFSKCAMVTESVVATLIANFLATVFNPGIPAKIFSSQDMALRWLLPDD